MLAIVHACAIVGIEGYVVDVEVDFNPRAGIPSFTIVGLPDAAVRESRERVRSAIKNSNYMMSRRRHGGSSQGLLGQTGASEDQKPYGKEQQQSGLQFVNKGYVVNLSPADLPKHGPVYDLAIAVGALAATDQIPLAALSKAVFIGELSLDGDIRHVKGIMPMVYAAYQEGYETAYVPAVDAQEAGLVQGIQIIPLETIGQLVEHLYNLQPISPYVPEPDSQNNSHKLPENITDFADIRGQEHVKRALEVAAAGNHHLLMQGPPGAGKTLLARAMPGILPLLTMEEALEVTRIYSVADAIQTYQPLKRIRAFRAPHHTISQAGLVGGGAIPGPGEISLAHRGILFLDELPEFGPRTLEVLRQPIEDKIVTISRASGTLTFPANFVLIAAMNPCPCGFYGDPVKPCTCTPAKISQYQSRISGPLRDRMDIHLDVPRVDYDKLMSVERGESSAQVRERVEKARSHQRKRFSNQRELFANADMRTGDIQKFCILTDDARQILELSVRRMQLSARAYHRVLKLSRTIADLADSNLIEVQHVAEAIQYRSQQVSG